MFSKSNLIIKLIGILMVCGVCLGSHSSKPVLVNVQVDVESEGDKEYVYNILGEIEKRGWSVTVYFTGEFAMEYPDIVKDIHDKRHQIAVCGWTGVEDLTLLDYQEQLDLIDASFTAVRKAINNYYYAYIADFRPQGLKQNENTFKALQHLNVRSNAGFLASETKTHPYHTDYGFIAIPIATVKQGSEDIPLIDKTIFNSGASIQDYLDYLKKRYDESVVTKEPFSIIVSSSVIGSDEAKLDAFTLFLDYVKDTNGQVVMTDFMTTLANPYMSDLRIFVDPIFDAYSGNDVPINGSFYANCDCPTYYIRIYGKYLCDVEWTRLDSGQFVDEGASVGLHNFSGLITIPYSYCNEPNYILMAVGRACHGVCWPTYDSFEDVNEIKLRLNNPNAGKRINGIERTDVPGVDRFCPRGGQCVELKPGDLLFNEPWMIIPIGDKKLVPRFPFWHVGIYAGDGWVIESVPGIGVRKREINKFDGGGEPFKGGTTVGGTWKGATTVLGFNRLCPCEEKERRNTVVNVASSYLDLGTPYSRNIIEFLNWNPDCRAWQTCPPFVSGETLQCAQLAYLVYKSIGYDLRYPINWLTSVASEIWPNPSDPKHWLVTAIGNTLSISPIGIYFNTSSPIRIGGSGVLGHDSYSRLVDPPPLDIWPQPTICKIYPNGVFSEVILVDPTISTIIFALGWEHNSSNLLLTIYNPNGVVVSDSNIVHERDEQLGGEYYIIESPKTGIWTMNVTSLNVPEEGENYTLLSYFASNLNIIPTLENQWYSPGENVRISANLTDSGLFIGDVNLTAEVYKPDGSSSVVALYDDGSHGDIQSNDGVYSGLFSETSIDGNYNIKITAHGTVSGSRFDRETYESFYVRRQTAEIISCLDSGSDTSGDGLYDLLGLNVFVNIIKPGDYRLTASLYDQNQAFIDRLSKETYLDSGFHTVELDFDGMAIYDHGVGGQYKGNVGIYDGNGIQMDYKEGYSNAQYSYTDFQCGGQITGLVIDPNGQPIEGAYLQVNEIGDVILSDDFNDNNLDFNWEKWQYPGEQEFSVNMTNGEIKIERITTESTFEFVGFGYMSTVNQNVEASIRVRTPKFSGDRVGFDFTVWNGESEEDFFGICRHDDYYVLGRFNGRNYWDCGSIDLFGDEAHNFHTYKIIYEKSKKIMSFFVDYKRVCTVEDVNFNDFRFSFGVDCSEWEMDAHIDVRIDDFLVKEFTGFTSEIKGTAFTDPNGAYAISRLLPAKYKISVLQPEGKNLPRGFTVVVLDKDETETVNFILYDEEDFETGDFSKFNWILSGDANWFVTPQEKHSGSYSARAGEIDDYENTSLSVTLDCISGNITFYLKVSSESGWDFLKFYIDGVEKGGWSGEQNWLQVSFPVTEGTRTFKWIYSKDSIRSRGSDTAWLDDIVFPLN